MVRGIFRVLTPTGINHSREIKECGGSDLRIRDAQIQHSDSPRMWALYVLTQILRLVSPVQGTSIIEHDSERQDRPPNTLSERLKKSQNTMQHAMGKIPEE